MNREIKFRAWDKEFNRITDGNWLNDENLAISLNGELFSLEYKKGGENGSWTKYKDIANRFTLMEFTGLKDNNGKDIYEGDIVKSDVGLCEVEWIGSGLSLHTLPRESSRSIFSVNYHECEVIGNIFENTNLLNK